MGYIISRMFQPKIIAAVDTHSFSINGVSFPRAYIVKAAGTQDAVLISTFDKAGETISVLSTSSVGGTVPANQAALIAALSAIVKPA